MANIFANLGPGLAKEAGDQATWSKIVNGQAGHFNAEDARHQKAIEKAGKKRNLTDNKEGAMSKVLRNSKAYMTGQDLNYKDTEHLRTKAVLARGAMATTAGATAVLAPRYMSGGDATTNRKGERDIAGIPFI